MRIEIILFIIVVHWLADFVFQSSWMAENKSKSWEALLSHTSLYTSIWCVAAILYAMIKGAFTGWTLSIKFWLFLFPIITFITHTIIDYYTSRVNKQLLNEASIKSREGGKPDYHDFFTSIGFDQLLHYTQLFLTYYLLNKL